MKQFVIDSFKKLQDEVKLLYGDDVKDIRLEEYQKIPNSDKSEFVISFLKKNENEYIHDSNIHKLVNLQSLKYERIFKKFSISELNHEISSIAIFQ